MYNVFDDDDDVNDVIKNGCKMRYNRDSGNAVGGLFALPGVLGVERWWRFRVERFNLVGMIRRGRMRLKSYMMLSKLIAGYLWVARR